MRFVVRNDLSQVVDPEKVIIVKDGWMASCFAQTVLRNATQVKRLLTAQRRTGQSGFALSTCHAVIHEGGIRKDRQDIL